MSRIPIDLEGVELKSPNGVWRIEYIAPPKPASDGDRVNYYLRITWADQKNPDNKVTPERRLRLTIYPSEASNQDGFRERLIASLTEWAGFFGDVEAVFTFAEGLRENRPS